MRLRIYLASYLFQYARARVNGPAPKLQKHAGRSRWWLFGLLAWFLVITPRGRTASNLVAGTRAASAKLRPMIARQITETGEQRGRELAGDAAPSPRHYVSSAPYARLRTIVSQVFPMIAQLDSRERIAPISGMKCCLNVLLNILLKAAELFICYSTVWK